MIIMSVNLNATALKAIVSMGSAVKVIVPEGNRGVPPGDDLIPKPAQERRQRLQNNVGCNVDN